MTPSASPSSLPVQLRPPSPRRRARYALPAVRGKEVLGPDDAQCLTQFIADDVLPAIAARQGEIRRFDVPATREPGDDLGILIVRVRADDQHPRRDTQAAQCSA